MSLTQHDPGLDCLGAYSQLQPLDNAVLRRLRPCLDSWQATDAGHLHHDVQLLSRCPALRRHPRYRVRYLLGGGSYFVPSGQDAGQVSHLPGSLGNPWNPLVRITTSTD